VSILCPDCGERRCAACRRRLFGALGGAAERRGELWAERVVRKLMRADRALQPWPAFDDPRAGDIARRMVADLCPELADDLAPLCHASAARRYGKLLLHEERDKMKGWLEWQRGE